MYNFKVLNCFLDNRFGGPQRRAYNVAAGLREYNIETVFLCNEKIKNNIPIPDFKCILLRHLQFAARKAAMVNLFLFCLWSPYNLCKILKIIRTEQIDLIHANGIVNILPALAAKLSGKKVVWHLNDTLTPRIIRRILLPLLSLFSDRIAIAAEKVGSFYFGSYKKLWQKSIILYAPVDINEFNPHIIDIAGKESLRAEFNISAGNFVVGAIGNINITKGYEYFIEAAHIVKKEEPNLKFIIVGERLDSKLGYYQKIKNLIKTFALEDDFILTGFRKDIVNIISLFDVFVLSSVREACPVVVLEALAMRVPVVATNVGGVGEQVINEESGFLIPARRPDFLAQTILRILNMSKGDTEKMIAKGRRRVEEYFSLDIIVSKHRQVYGNILAG